jgi:hypothetical protein
MRVLVTLFSLGVLAAPGLASGQPATPDRDPAGCRVGQSVGCPSLRMGVPAQMSIGDAEQRRAWEALKTRIDPLLADGRCEEAAAVLVSEGRHALAVKLRKACKGAA